MSNEKTKTTLGIVTICGLVVAMNVISYASAETAPQVSDETTRLQGLSTELAKYGYVEMFDLTSDGSMVEFKTVEQDADALGAQEDTICQLVVNFGFECVEYGPAPPTEDDILIIGMGRVA